MDENKFILIVDDDLELGDLLAMAVEDISDTYVVKVARDVDEAMVEVRRSQTTRQPFDIVITDIKMAGLTGLELLEALAAIAPETKTVAMTAYNSPDLARRAQELGVYAYLTKPFIISELRQLVQSALEPGPAKQAPTEAVSEPDLTLAQKTAVRDQLATLRSMTGAIITLLLHNSGNVLAVDDIEPDSPDMAQLGEALMDIDQTLSKHIRQTFGGDSAIRQSYFGTESYNLCTYRLDESRVAAVVFGPTVKEGQVWYYMREALPTLLDALQAEASTPSSARTQQAGDVFEMLDQFFPDRHKTGTSTEAVQPGVSTPTHSPDSGPSGDEPGEDLSSLDQIDWEAPVEADWDTLAAATEQGIKGITFEEAQQQGLIPSDLTNDAQQEVTASSGQAAAVGADLPPVDSIDWQVSTETDWEAFIAGTDQGLDGIGFEEAKKRGLIDGLADGTETS